MSKEKNLTMVRTINGHRGPCVDPQTHLYCREEIREHYDPDFPTIRRMVCPPVEGLFGPAIDRLHEFEKLGMEPEEIEKILGSSSVAVLRELERIKAKLEQKTDEYCKQSMEFTVTRDKLKEDNRDLNEQIEALDKERASLYDENIAARGAIETLRKELAWYTGQHSTLISQNRNQAKTIKRLMDENEELKDGKYYRTVLERNKELIVENANLKNRLHDKTNEYSEKIMAMSEDCDELQEENERLKQYVDLYTHMVDSAINLSTAMLNSLKEAHNERKKES